MQACTCTTYTSIYVIHVHICIDIYLLGMSNHDPEVCVLEIAIMKEDR